MQPLLLKTTDGNWFSRIARKISEFVTSPASPRPLAVFRIGIAGVLLFQALLISGSVQDLFGENGFVHWSTFGNIEDREMFGGLPNVLWIVDAFAFIGVKLSNAAAVQGVFLAYVGSLSCLLIGWRSNSVAVVSWLAHFVLKTTGEHAIYGVDAFTTIALFYCTWMPVGHDLSVDRHSGRLHGGPTWTARLGLRVLQIHLCIIYLTSGIDKASGEQWWNGEAIWRALGQPELATMNFFWLASVPLLAKLVCWGTLAVELFYAVLVWPRFSRKWMAWATIGLHVGIAATMSLVSFSAVMCVLTGSAFLVSAKPIAAGEEPASEASQGTTAQLAATAV